MHYFCRDNIFKLGLSCLVGKTGLCDILFFTFTATLLLAVIVD